MIQALYSYERYYAPAGRILVGAFFLLAGIGKIMGVAGTAGYIASVGLPFPGLLVWLVILLEIGGGLALITGFQAKCAALLLASFSLVAAIFFHSPGTWADDPGQQINFMKNIALMGALLFMSAHMKK